MVQILTEKIVTVSRASRRALELTKLSTQRVAGASFPGVKLPGREAEPDLDLVLRLRMSGSITSIPMCSPNMHIRQLCESYWNKHAECLAEWQLRIRDTLEVSQNVRKICKH